MAKRVPHLDRSLTSADTLTPSDGRRRFHATVLFVFVLSVFFSFYSASFIAAFLSTLEGLVVVPFYDRNSPFESVCLSFFSFFFEGGGLLRSCKNEAPLVNRIEKKTNKQKTAQTEKETGRHPSPPVRFHLVPKTNRRLTSFIKFMESELGRRLANS